jgi:hypothetical protein
MYNANPKHRSAGNPGVGAHHQRALELNNRHITQDSLPYSTFLRRNLLIYLLHFTNLRAVFG